jgi:30S ribosome assembly GTPase
VETTTCAGCGAVLQTENPERAGYVPASALERERIICRRCYRMTHYNEPAPVELGDQDFLNVLHSIGETQGLIVKMIDLFDVSGSWISGLPRFVGSNPILLVANKMDLFPNSVNVNKLKTWLQKSAKEQGLRPVDVLVCSAEKSEGIERVMEAMERHRRGRDVYIVGMTNVGKSTFINQILKQFGAKSDELLTTSRFPGTTLDLIRIPLDDNQSLYDTPGIINRSQMTHYVGEKDLKIITPQKTIKPKVYQLNEGQTLFFGGAARLDFVRGEQQSFVCYMSNLMNIHRTKLENADDLYANHLGEMLAPPAKDHLSQWPGLVKFPYRIRRNNTDIVFPGLGWVTVKGGTAQVIAHVPKGVDVSMRPALV